jgi:hypothetical protein
MFQVFHLDVAYVAMTLSYVSSVCFKCFRCFRLMLQAFHLDVAMSIHACFICFRRMLQMSYLDVSKIDLVLHGVGARLTAACHSHCWGAAMVTMRALEAGRCLRDAHPQAGQVTRTHVGFPVRARGHGSCI